MSTATPQRSDAIDDPATGQPSPAASAEHGSRLRGILSGASWALVLAALALALIVFAVPRLLGGQALTVLSGSMEPAYSAGDVVVVVPEEHYGIGDVVAFQPVSGDPTLITHRIVGMGFADGEASYRTQGDANGSADKPIVEAQIMGSVRYGIPKIGHVALAAGEHQALLASLLGAGLLGYGIVSVARGAFRRTETRT